MTVEFRPGSTYRHRRFGAFTVIRRTAKFVTLHNEHGEARRVGVKTHNGVEFCYPDGIYSQCPVLKADREAETAR